MERLILVFKGDYTKQASTIQPTLFLPLILRGSKTVKLVVCIIWGMKNWADRLSIVRKSTYELLYYSYTSDFVVRVLCTQYSR